MNNYRKKIAIICTGFYPGGFTSSLRSMLACLYRGNIYVDIYTYGQAESGDEPEIKIYGKIIPVPHKAGLSAYHKQLACELGYFNARYLKKDKTAQKQMEMIAYTRNNLPQMDLTEYDAVISWEELQCNYFLAQNVKARKKIGYMHPDYRKAGFSKKIDLPLFEKLDHIVCVSKATQKIMQEEFPDLADRIAYVPNPLDTERIDSLVKKEEHVFQKSSFDIVTVCRIENRSKALDRIVRIAAALEKDRYVFNWYIIGDGPDYDQIQMQIKEMHVKSVHLLGQKKNPYPYMKKADLFALLSNYEGKPVTVDEAQYLGIPVIVTDYSSAHEQIKNGDGLIVENSGQKILSMMENILKNPLQLSAMKMNLLTCKDSYDDISSFLSLL